MTRRDVLTAAVWGLGTLGLAMASFMPASLDATGPQDRVASTIASPTLAAKGCELSLRPVGEGKWEVGQKPAFELVVVNKGATSAEFEYKLAMTATRPASPMARMLPTPQTIWQDTRTIAVGPGESRTISIETNTAIPAGNVAVRLAVGDQSIIGWQSSGGVVPLDLLRQLSQR